MRRGGGDTTLLHEIGRGGEAGRGIPKWRQPSSWVRGDDVTGEGGFQNLKMALRAFRIGATYCLFKVLLIRVDICLRYFGLSSPPRNLCTRAGIGAQARPQPIRGNSNRVFDYDF